MVIGPPKSARYSFKECLSLSTVLHAGSFKDTDNWLLGQYLLVQVSRLKGEYGNDNTKKIGTTLLLGRNSMHSSVLNNCCRINKLVDKQTLSKTNGQTL